MSDIDTFDFANLNIKYFDHASATPPLQNVLERYSDNLKRFFYNQEAGHYGGFALKKAMTDCGERLCRALFSQDAANRMVFFCNSATEAFNIVCAFPDIEQGVITTDSLEHPALLANIKKHNPSLINWLKINETGKIQYLNNIDSSFLFVHSVQSELGVRQNVDLLMSSNCTRIIDAVQSAGKFELPENNDIIIISGAKFGAPGGAALLVNAKWKYFDRFCRHVHEYRHIKYEIGRVSFALAESLTNAAEWWQKNRAEVFGRISQYNHYLRDEFQKIGIKCTIKESDASPYILHLSLPEEYPGAVFVRALSEQNIMAAAGAACASESKEPSNALLALGYSKKAAYAGLRLSFGYTTKEAEVVSLPAFFKQIIKNF